MSSQKSDIVVLGATGFTGRLITRYLSTHPQFTQGLFSFSIAARSTTKLQTLVEELSLSSNINTIQVDVTKDAEVEAVVKSAKVIINTVGPYWRWGTPVVRACAKNGVHYVDLTGESVWIKEIIHQFDYLASKTGAVIVPSCGMDSVPSDISAFLSNKTLKAHGPYDVGTSVTAHKVRGGISGGTFSTMITMLEDVPKDKLNEAGVDYSLSSFKGRTMPTFQLSYDLAIPGEIPILGAFFFMQPTNRKLVQRTFGLLEAQAADAKQDVAAGTSASAETTKTAQAERYGPAFGYDEFIVMPSRLKAMIFSTVSVIGFGMIALVTPARWLFKKLIPQPGEGPSEEDMLKGYIQSTNHTTSTSTPPVHVKTTLKGDGDPGYLLTSIMISESALSLVLPPTSATTSANAGSSSSAGRLPAGLPALAYKGGILTSMSAFGSVLVTRLAESGRFEFESHVVGEGAAVEGRKDV